MPDQLKPPSEFYAIWLQKLAYKDAGLYARVNLDYCHKKKAQSELKEKYSA